MANRRLPARAGKAEAGDVTAVCGYGKRVVRWAQHVAIIYGPSGVAKSDDADPADSVEVGIHAFDKNRDVAGTH
jgi:hypothetical protein